MSSKSWCRSGAVSSIVVAVVRVMDVVLQLCFPAVWGLVMVPLIITWVGSTSLQGCNHHHQDGIRYICDICVGIRDFPNSPTFSCNPGILGGPCEKLATCQGSSLESQNHLSGDGDVSSLKYCWWFRNPVNSPVHFGKISAWFTGVSYIQKVVGLGISEPSTVLRCVCKWSKPPAHFLGFITVYVGDVALKRVLLGEPI